MSALKLTDPSYTHEKVSNYIVSILLSQNGLSFCIRDHLSNRLVHLEHYPEVQCFQNFGEVQQLVREHLTDKSQYRSVYLVLDDPRITFVPLPYAGEEANARFFELNFPLDGGEKLMSFYHRQTELTSVFPLQNTMHDFFISFFKEVNVLHICDAAVWNALSYHTSSQGHFTVIVQENRFYLIGVEKDKLLINTHFNYQTADDFLFFLLNTFKQFEFSQYDARIVLTGNVDAATPLVEKLKTFVAQVEFETWPSYVNYADELYTIGAHRFFHLLIASHCE